VGSGLLAVSPDAGCEARDIAWIAAAEFAAGRLVPAELARPVYLRDRVTHQTTGKVKGGQAGLLFPSSVNDPMGLDLRSNRS
jgi:tRNA threonylcarbamoyladenosine biosynthesis protein TsaB